MRLNAFFSGATFFAIIYPTEMIMIAKIIIEVCSTKKKRLIAFFMDSAEKTTFGLIAYNIRGLLTRRGGPQKLVQKGVHVPRTIRHSGVVKLLLGWIHNQIFQNFTSVQVLRASSDN